MAEDQNVPVEISAEQTTHANEEVVNENILQQKTFEQFQTENSKHETENMEVHHHPHVEKKSFKEYLLEGLMIFLAVTMGFIAENIREGISKHEKAEVFAASMKSDLKNDTIQLDTYLKYFRLSANNVDTFMQLLSANDVPDIPTGKLYWYGLFGGARSNFVPNDATFQQMKSSGSIELFKPQTAIDVEKYDRFCRTLQAFDDMNKDVYTEVRKTRALIFEFKYNDIANQIALKNRELYNQASVDSFIASNPPLLNNDKVLFNQYIELVRSRFLRRYNVAYADSLLLQANVVLKDLNNDFK